MYTSNLLPLLDRERKPIPKAWKVCYLLILVSYTFSSRTRVRLLFHYLPLAAFRFSTFFLARFENKINGQRENEMMMGETFAFSPTSLNNARSRNDVIFADNIKNDTVALFLSAKHLGSGCCQMSGIFCSCALDPLRYGARSLTHRGIAGLFICRPTIEAKKDDLVPHFL